MRDEMQLVPVQRAVGALDPEPIPAGDLPVETPVQKIRRLLRGKFWWALLLGIALGAGGGSAGYFLNKPVWQGSAAIDVKPLLPRVLYSTEQNSVMPMFDAYIGAQVALARSERVLNNAMDSDDWKATGRGKSPEAKQQFRRSLTVTSSGEILRVTFEDPDVTVATRAVRAFCEKFAKIFNEEDYSQNQGRLRVLENKQGVLTADLDAKHNRAKAIAEKYGTDDLEPLHAQKLAAVGRLEADLWADEANLELQRLFRPTTAPSATTAPAGAVAGGPTTSPAVPFLGTSAEQIALVDMQMRQYVGEQRALNSALKVTRLVYEKNSQNVLRLEQQIDNLNTEIEAYRQAYLSLHGPVQPVDLTKQTGDAARLSDLQMAVLTKKVEKVRDELALKYADLKTIGTDNLALKNLRHDEAQISRGLDDITNRLAALNLEASASMKGRIEVLDGPTEIARDRRLSLGVLGGSGGLLLGFVIMMAISAATDTRWRSSQDARTRIGRTMMLGILPNLPEDLSEPEQAAIASHAVHHIRSLLQIRGEGDAHQVLSITSPASGTGKTSLALALGVSFASAGSRTLLVDCDLRGGGLTGRVNAIVRRKIGQILHREGLVTQPQLAEALDLAQRSHRPLGEMLVELGYLQQKDVAEALELQQQKQVGLLDALAGDDLNACVAATGIENLQILPLGAATVRHASRLSPASIRKLVESARVAFDLVLFDGGPVPGSLEASQVAAEVDGVVLVVSRGEERLLAEHCMETLGKVGAKVAGVVFNRADQQDVALYGTTLRSAGLSVPAAASGSSRLGPMANAVAGESR